MTKEKFAEILNGLSKEQGEKLESQLKAADTAEKMIAAYDTIGIKLNQEVAQKLVNNQKEISDEDLEQVAGGGTLGDITKLVTTGFLSYYTSKQQMTLAIVGTATELVAYGLDKLG